MSGRLRQRGASLVEVLIAVLILAVGLLGYASVQSEALKLNSEALQQARASTLADDWFERLRANGDWALNSNDYLFDNPPNSPSAPSCAAQSCSPAQLARYDLHQWWQQLEQTLPGVTASSQRYGRQFQLILRWPARPNAVASEQRFVTAL